MNVGVPVDALTVQGELSIFERPGGSGMTVRRRFCGHCGSPIDSEIDVMPGVAFLEAGTLDDRGWVKPAVEVWCQRKLPWATLPENLPKAAQNPQR